ncbi:MAG: T9SS type A sorting domain-containing protein [bacterium]
MNLSAPATVRPQEGLPPVLSRLPMEGTSSPVQFPLDESDNFRINTDHSGQLQNEEMVCVNPLNANELVAIWRDFRFGYRRVGVGFSTDGGFTWQDDVFPQMYYPWQSDPILVVDDDGVFTAMVISFDPDGEDGLLSVRSTDGGRTWRDSLFAVNANPLSFEDKEMFTVDRTESPYHGSFYCVWTRFFGYPATDSTHIALVSKRADSANYEPPLYVSQTTWNQWANVAVGTEGQVYVSWVSYLRQALVFSRSTDGGISFSPEQVVTPTRFSSADINGDILIFSYGAMAVDETNGPHCGRLYMVYTDATSDYSETEIWLVYSDDDGATWSSPQRMNDDEVAYPADQFHPWVTVDPVGRVWVVFYDRRNDPNNYLVDVYFAVSTDGGQSWRPNERITTTSFDPRAGSARAGLLGEYIGLCASETRAHVVWTDTRLGDQDVFGTVLDSVFLAADPSPFINALPSRPTLVVFPNPANNSAWLQYDLPQSGQVSLVLYNILGEKVWNWPLGLRNAGSQRFHLELSRFASGLYIAQLESKVGTARAKVLLLK